MARSYMSLSVKPPSKPEPGGSASKGRGIGDTARVGVEMLGWGGGRVCPHWF